MKIHLSISGMHCQSCEQKIQDALTSVDGVRTARVSLETQLAEISTDRDLSLKEMQEAVSTKGDYRIEYSERDSEAEAAGATKTDSLLSDQNVYQMEHEVEHRPHDSRFIVKREGRESYLAYQRPKSGGLSLESTFVPPPDRRHGIAESLTIAALEFADSENLRVIPACSYVDKFIDDHPKYKSLLDGDPGESNVADESRNSRSISSDRPGDKSTEPQSWLQTYKPLLIIVAYLIGGTVVTAINSTAGWTMMNVMSVFMGLFFTVFSFFKMLDLKGFASAYSSYDLIAARWYGYGFVYPFIELGLGLMYLLGIQPVLTNSLTAIVMAISTLGVVNAVVRGRDIQCGCLGTMFDLPMSTVTIVEDVTMLLMALAMIGILAT